MNSRSILILSLVAVSFAPSTRAQLNLDVTAQIRLGRALPPPPPEVIVVEQGGPPGPSSWGAARWYRPSRPYYYYPGSDVYYRPADHVWFYLDRGTWRFGARLPDNIRVDFGRAVSFNLDTDRPYTYHSRVVASYPANYFSRVKFKNDRDNRRDDHNDNRRDNDDHRGNDDRNDHGKDHDKDKHR